MKARTSFSFTIVGIDWMRHGAERKTFASVLHLGNRCRYEISGEKRKGKKGTSRWQGQEREREGL
jgi:hypothetical protein